MVQSRPLQLPPQGDDALPQLSVDGPRVAVGAAGLGLHRFPAAGLVAGHQGVHPAPRHLVSACCFGLAQLLLYHRQDDDPFLRHGSSSKSGCYERCLDSPMNDVLNLDTKLHNLSSTIGFTRTPCSPARGCLSLGMPVAGELRDGVRRRPADGRFVGNPPGTIADVLRSLERVRTWSGCSTRLAVVRRFAGERCARQRLCAVTSRARSTARRERQTSVSRSMATQAQRHCARR
jgi:hypothetical protein